MIDTRTERDTYSIRCVASVEFFSNKQTADQALKQFWEQLSEARSSWEQEFEDGSSMYVNFETAQSGYGEQEIHIVENPLTPEERVIRYVNLPDSKAAQSSGLCPAPVQVLFRI